MRDRIDPQPVTIDVRPVDLLEDRGRVEALAAAEGRDLVRERVTRVTVIGALVLAFLVIARCILA